jgi:hypothetical protein
VNGGLRRQSGCLLAVLAVACLLVVSSATAGRVAWNEAAKSGGVKVMTYTVDSLTFGANGWSAHVSFRNVSHVSIGMSVRREFEAAFFADPKTETLTQAVGFAPATTFSSKLPTLLKPGASWTGTISGTGRLSTNQRIYARVVFGPFSGLPGTKTSVVWITDHSLTLGKAAVPVGPTGPVI